MKDFSKKVKRRRNFMKSFTHMPCAPPHTISKYPGWNCYIFTAIVSLLNTKTMFEIEYETVKYVYCERANGWNSLKKENEREKCIKHMQMWMWIKRRKKVQNGM